MLTRPHLVGLLAFVRIARIALANGVRHKVHAGVNVHLLGRHAVVLKVRLVSASLKVDVARAALGNGLRVAALRVEVARAIHKRLQVVGVLVCLGHRIFRRHVHIRQVPAHAVVLRAVLVGVGDGAGVGAGAGVGVGLGLRCARVAVG